ncbi:MAG: hypothetical protein ACRERS_11070 [Methylococcales bacterium]
MYFIRTIGKYGQSGSSAVDQSILGQAPRATGKIPEIAYPVVIGDDPFRHPDALLGFRVMNNVEELARALDFPWDQWTVFLHPAR